MRGVVRATALAWLLFAGAGCVSYSEPTGQTVSALCGPGGCCTPTGAVDSTLSPDSLYYLTSFGGGGFGAGCSYDTQSVACGGREADGCWYYAADHQRWPCGTHLRLSRPDAPTRCVVVQVADTGPDSCVEHVAGKRIIDASPVVAYDLFAVSCLGWSDARTVQATVVPSSTPLGPCTQHGECSTAPPAAAGGSGTGAWTCSADRSARARCIDNQHLECDECPAGAMCATSGGSSVCPSAADGGTPDAGSDASVTDAHADGSGDATGDAGSDGAAPDAPDAAAGDVAVARDAPCEGGDVCGRGVVMHAGCGCRAPARSTSVGAIGWMLVVAIALGRGRWRRRSA